MRKSFVEFCLVLIFVVAMSSVSFAADSLLHQGAALLTPQDFTYLGYYNINNNGMDTVYGQGLTHRYVNGDLRFLTVAYTSGQGRLDEFSLGGKTYGDTISANTNQWPNLLQLTGQWIGLWWEEPAQRLWSVNAVDYTTTVYQVQIYTRTLNNDGTVSNLHGPVGIQGISAKRVYGGCDAVPSWFRAQYNIGPYVCGWGGYTSLVAQGGGASLGGTMYAIPDPAGYVNNTEIPIGFYKTLMDHISGTVSGDWYATGNAPTSFDRGVRITIPTNYFDGGDLRPNGNCPTCNGVEPTLPPAPGAGWLSPAPDGLGRWIWGDSYYNTGTWIDTPTKTGFIAIGTFDGGKAWYCASQFCSNKRQYELHIYDPTQFGEAIQGTRPLWKVQPSSMTELILPGMGTRGQGITGGIAGATYDPLTKRLYVLADWTDDTANRLFVYAVDDPTAVPGQMTPTPASTPLPTSSLPQAPAPPENQAPTATPLNGPVKDNFNMPDATTLGSNWSHGYGGNQGLPDGDAGIASNKAYATSSTYGISMVYWNANTFNNDQYSQFVVGSPPSGSSFQFAAVRVTTVGSGHARGKGYIGMRTGEIWQLDNEGVHEQLAAGDGRGAAGDVIKLTAIGNNLVLYRNGIPISNATDSTYPSGVTGFGFLGWGDTIDDWEGGNLAPIISGIIIRGHITKSGGACAGCVINITIQNTNAAATTMSDGTFTLVFSRTFSPGSYTADITITDGTTVKSFRKRISIN